MTLHPWVLFFFFIDNRFPVGAFHPSHHWRVHNNVNGNGNGNGNGSNSRFLTGITDVHFSTTADPSSLFRPAVSVASPNRYRLFSTTNISRSSSSSRTFTKSTSSATEISIKNETDTTQQHDNDDKIHLNYRSYTETVKCQNLMYNAASESEDHEVVIHLGNDNEDNEGPNLVAVTGETGSGKSLLVFKVFQLILGEKVSSSIMRGSPFASGEVVIKLSEPHLSQTKSTMKALGLNTSDMVPSTDGYAQLTLKRTIEGQKKTGRFRSKCEINGKQITLKVLRTIAKPLITTVDASLASSALSQNKARIAIIDTGVSNDILSNVRQTKKMFNVARKKREEIEREIQNRVLPISFTPSDGDENLELLQHWIDELDEFERRVSNFQESIVSSRGTATFLAETDENDEIIDDNDFELNGGSSSNSEGTSFIDILKRFANASWEKDETTNPESSSSIGTLFYSNLLDLRDGVKSIDSQLAAAHASCDALSSLSSSQSVAFALEQSRNHLFDATTGYDGNQALNDAAETSHELLNKIEDALSSCASFMSDHQSGLISTLEKMRQSVHVSVEDIDFLIADWGSFTRKHGVSPFSLPSLHHSLRQEVDGNVEARLMLPKAKEEENIALFAFENACKELSQARLTVCSSLTDSVTSRLKDLGMEGSAFTSQLNHGIYKCTEPSAYSDGAILGIDSVDFLLTHRTNVDNKELYDDGVNIKNENKGNLEVIGSSGEKARLLLAIETDLPGSVGASCNSLNGNNDVVEVSDNMNNNPGPVTVVYDEIDAHVGGRAAVSLAKLLADQARCRKGGISEEAKRNQVISITHSPSLAAIADRHIVIQKMLSNGHNGSKDSVLVDAVRGLSRLQEISRMASGDLAVKESIQFAEALLRDGLKYKLAQTSNSQVEVENNNDSR